LLNVVSLRITGHCIFVNGGDVGLHTAG
jgi:hypothetical protein